MPAAGRKRLRASFLSKNFTYTHAYVSTSTTTSGFLQSPGGHQKIAAGGCVLRTIINAADSGPCHAQIPLRFVNFMFREREQIWPTRRARAVAVFTPLVSISGPVNTRTDIERLDAKKRSMGLIRKSHSHFDHLFTIRISRQTEGGENRWKFRPRLESH